MGRWSCSVAHELSSTPWYSMHGFLYSRVTYAYTELQVIVCLVHELHIIDTMLYDRWHLIFHVMSMKFYMQTQRLLSTTTTKCQPQRHVCPRFECLTRRCWFTYGWESAIGQPPPSQHNPTRHPTRNERKRRVCARGGGYMVRADGSRIKIWSLAGGTTVVAVL